MGHALLKARGWSGATWPNPCVGACLVDANGRLLAAGVHRGPGSDHAEVVALCAASARRPQFAGCTLYVTLEPCNHQGRTPPCTEAILRAGVGRVVIGCIDSNPHVAGHGAEFLRSRGVHVEMAGQRLQQLARELNHPFFESDGGRRPHLTLKLALSADDALARRFGRVDDATQRAISAAAAQRRAHRMRASASCVLVGRGTVASDHPQLSVRWVSLPAGRRPPRPVVLDSALRLLPSDVPAGSLVLHATQPDAKRAELWQEAGCELCAIEGDARGLRWAAILAELQARDLGVVLVEGGANVAASLLTAGLPDRLHLFRAAWRVDAPAPRLAGLDARSDFRLLRQRRLGADRESVYVRLAAGDDPGSARA